MKRISANGSSPFRGNFRLTDRPGSGRWSESAAEGRALAAVGSGLGVGKHLTKAAMIFQLERVGATKSA
jgi:hypothetical protein